LKGKENKASPVRIPLASRHPAASLSKAIDKITVSDTISRSIEKWIDRQHEKKVDHKFVHGNLRLDNVLVAGNKVCLIDFENCGYGPIYTDLSWTCSLILLTRTLPLFPWKRAQFALNSFLDGYKRVSAYDHEILHQFVTMLLCYHYIDAFYLGKMRAKWIAGIPVSKSRFQHLLVRMLEGKVDPMLERVNF
jgi:Ser/Thr protein kinase RdoA (MazF antagonist)